MIRTVRRAWRAIAVTAGVALVSFAALAAPATGAQAGGTDASARQFNCVFAPGDALAQHCVDVQRGSGGNLYVAQGSSNYQGIGTHCNVESTFRWTPFGSGTQAIRTVKRTSCTSGSARITTTHNSNMRDGSTYCSRQKNSTTGQVFSDWTCRTISA